MKTYGEERVELLTSALDGGERSDSRPGPFMPRERALTTYWIGSWVGPRAGMDAVGLWTNHTSINLFVFR
jgi:hypothetical protein